MHTVFCPKCSSDRILWIGEDSFRCQTCGYVGTQSGKKLFKS